MLILILGLALIIPISTIVLVALHKLTKIQIINRYKIAACAYISFANATSLLIRVGNGLCKAFCLKQEKLGITV